MSQTKRRGTTVNNSWGCPYESNGKCTRVNNIPCDPGMKGCILFGRFVMAEKSKNLPGGPRPGDRKIKRT